MDEEPAGHAPLSDAALVRACNEGNAAERNRSFGILYERHRNYVMSVASRVTSDPDLAEDVVQDTFEHLLRLFPPFGQGVRAQAKLTTLLFTMAKNQAISVRRKQGRCVASEVDPDDLAAPDCADTDALDVARFLRMLPPAQQIVVRLRYVEDRRLGDIADTLHIPVGTVKSRIHTAVHRLQDSCSSGRNVGTTSPSHSRAGGSPLVSAV